MPDSREPLSADRRGVGVAQHLSGPCGPARHAVGGRRGGRLRDAARRVRGSPAPRAARDRSRVRDAGGRVDDPRRISEAVRRRASYALRRRGRAAPAPASARFSLERIDAIRLTTYRGGRAVLRQSRAAHRHPGAIQPVLRHRGRARARRSRSRMPTTISATRSSRGWNSASSSRPIRRVCAAARRSPSRSAARASLKASTTSPAIPQCR